MRIVVSLVMLVLLAGHAGGCGGGDEADSGGPLDGVTLEGLESGVVALSLSARSAGAESGSLEVRVSGPFATRGRDLPTAHLTASAEGGSGRGAVDFEGSLTLLPDRGFLEYRGTTYEIDPENFAFAKASFLPRKPGGNKKTGPSALSACLEAAAATDVEGIARKLTTEPGGRLEGASVRKVTGELDPGRAIAAIEGLAENPSCRAQLTAAGGPGDRLEEAVEDLGKTVDEAHLEIYVGEDGIVRKLAGELRADPKDGARSSAEVEFSLTLSAVNEDPRIPAPSRGQPILSWLESLGLDPFGALFIFSEKTALGDVIDLIAEDLAPKP